MQVFENVLQCVEGEIDKMENCDENTLKNFAVFFEIARFCKKSVFENVKIGAILYAVQGPQKNLPDKHSQS